MAQRKQNHYLNFWKGIACFCVVFLHVRFPIEALDGILQTMCRFAVPLFFMISGYFCYGDNKEIVEKKLPGKIKRIFWINLAGCFYYFLVQMAIALFGDSHGSIKDVIEKLHMMFNKEAMVNWLVFNKDPFINIMWFTSALLYCYLLFWVINHFNLYPLFYGLIPTLLAFHFVIGNVLALFGNEIPEIYFRNFLLFGLPFFMLGNWLHKHKTRVLEKFTVEKCRGMICLGLFLGIGEWFLMGKREIYLGSLLVVVCVFLLALYQPEKKEKSIITKIGMKYSLFVYIVHCSVATVMERFADKLIVAETTIYYVYRFARPFVVFGISVAIAWAVYRVLDTRKIKTYKLEKE